jgi:hypothetical protein
MAAGQRREEYGAPGNPERNGRTDPPQHSQGAHSASVPAVLPALQLTASGWKASPKKITRHHGQIPFEHLAGVGLLRSGAQNLSTLIQPHHAHRRGRSARLVDFFRWSMASPAEASKKPPGMGAVHAGHCPPLVHLQGKYRFFPGWVNALVAPIFQHIRDMLAFTTDLGLVLKCSTGAVGFKKGTR